VSEPVPPLPCSIDELRTLFLFEKLTEDQLGWLCREGRVEHVGPGLVFGEGEPADCFYVLLDGEVVLSRRVGADDVEITRTSDRGVYAGAMQVYLGDRVPQAYTASLRAARLSRFFVLSAAAFGQMMRDWFPMMLQGTASRSGSRAAGKQGRSPRGGRPGSPLARKHRKDPTSSGQQALDPGSHKPEPMRRPPAQTMPLRHSQPPTEWSGPSFTSPSRGRFPHRHTQCCAGQRRRARRSPSIGRLVPAPRPQIGIRTRAKPGQELG
jgi:hypothetical protein